MRLRALVIVSVVVIGAAALYLRAGTSAVAGPAASPPIDSGSSSRVVLSRVPGGGIQPEVAVDEGGDLHMVYFAGEAGSGDLYHVRSADSGATFSEPIRVNSQAGSALATGTIRGGQIAVGSGRAHVAWPGSSTALPRGPLHPTNGEPVAPVLYARSAPGGGGFEPQRNLVAESYGLDGGSIAADGAGNVYVAWHGLERDAPEEEGARRVLMARSVDGGETFGPETPLWSEPTGACVCCGLRLFSPAAGELYALYRSATELVHRDMYLLRSSDSGRSFRGRRIDEWELAACPMSSMAMVGAKGRVFAAWETAQQIRFGAVDAAGPTVRTPAEATASGPNRKHPRLAVNDRGDVLLVWTEGTAWQRGGDLAWQLYDAGLQPLGAMGRQAGVPVWSFATPTARPDGSFVIFY